MKRKIQKLIYIETTIPSFYHTLRTDAESRVRQKWTRQWWAEYADIFTLVSSAAVIEELSGGTGEKIQDRLDLLKDVKLLSITGDIEQTARIATELLGRRRLKWQTKKSMKFAKSGTKFQHSLATMSADWSLITKSWRKN